MISFGPTGKLLVPGIPIIPDIDTDTLNVFPCPGDSSRFCIITTVEPFLVAVLPVEGCLSLVCRKAILLNEPTKYHAKGVFSNTDNNGEKKVVVIKGPVYDREIYFHQWVRDFCGEQFVPLILQKWKSDHPLLPGPYPNNPTYCSEDPKCYYSVPFIGPDLIDVRNDKETLDLAKILRIALLMFSNVVELQNNDCQHRDISLENFVLSLDGKVLFLIDWSFGWYFGKIKGVPVNELVVGKKEYIDPELLTLGRSEKKVVEYDHLKVGDYWSLLVTLFGWIFGFPLYAAIGDEHFQYLFCRGGLQDFTWFRDYVGHHEVFKREDQLLEKLIKWFQKSLVVTVKDRVPLTNLFNEFNDIVGQWDLSKILDNISMI